MRIQIKQINPYYIKHNMTLHLRMLFSLTLLLSIVSSQYICQNCIDSNNNSFTCNNINCQGFTLTKSQYNNRNQIFPTINCINNQNCYYSPNAPYVQSVYVYLFCNYTFPGCSTCTNGNTCSQCQPGYFSSVYNTELALYNCSNCGEFIGGCETCYNGEFCSQCKLDYMNVFGLCYTQGGSIVGSTPRPWNKHGSTPTQIITAVQLLLICVAIGFVFYKFCWKKGQSIRENDAGKIEYQQTYPAGQSVHNK